MLISPRVRPMVDAHMGTVGANRLSREALICVDWRDDNPENPLGLGPSSDYRTGLDTHTADVVATYEASTGRTVQIREADTGRGASVTGVAVELLEPIAVLGGAAAATREAVRGVAWAYRKIAHAMGRRPLVSLGAAECLAMNRLLERTDSPVEVFGSGDINNNSPDQSFTGGDAFYVVLSTGQGLRYYQVSAYGEVRHVGAALLPPNHWDEPPEVFAGSRWRRAWCWLMKADQLVATWMQRLGRWLVRRILRTTRAFLAGSGTGGLFIATGLVLADVRAVPTLRGLGVLLVGGAVGVVVQRYYRRMRWFAKVDKWLENAVARRPERA